MGNPLYRHQVELGRQFPKAIGPADAPITEMISAALNLAIERVQLQPVPTPYGGRSVRSLQKPVSAPIVGLQHPLSFYDAFAGGAS